MLLMFNGCVVFEGDSHRAVNATLRTGARQDHWAGQTKKSRMIVRTPMLNVGRDHFRIRWTGTLARGRSTLLTREPTRVEAE